LEVVKIEIGIGADKLRERPFRLELKRALRCPGLRVCLRIVNRDVIDQLVIVR